MRFFGVGEYGERGGRPHYHAAIFGLRPDDEDLLDKAWQSLGDDCYGARPGFTYHGQLDADGAAYVAGYVVKKLTKADDPRLSGRAPEFALMSRRPGIGLASIQDFVQVLETREGAIYLGRYKDVPKAFTCAGRHLPIGNYLRQKLRLYFFGSHLKPREAADQEGLIQHEKTQAQLLEYLPPMSVDASAFERWSAWDQANDQVRKQMTLERLQRGRQVAARHKIHSSRRKL